jgi:hypothetical protein
MCLIKQLVAVLGMVALVGTGCATQSGTGVKVRGNQDFQTVQAQVDLLEAREVVQQEGSVISAIGKPFVWISENPGKAALGTVLAVGAYVAYDEYAHNGGGSSSESSEQVAKPIKGVTQSGSGNTAVFKDVAECPDAFQQGHNNHFECDVSVDNAVAQTEAAVRIAEFKHSQETEVPEPAETLPQ